MLRIPTDDLDVSIVMGGGIIAASGVTAEGIAHPGMPLARHDVDVFVLD
jgi:hypothetical protein